MRNRIDVIKKLKGASPLAAEIFLKTSGVHFAYIDIDQKVGAVVLEINAPVLTNNISDFLHHDVVDKAMELMQYNLNLLVELEDNCPFSQWRVDLETLKG